MLINIFPVVFFIFNKLIFLLCDIKFFCCPKGINVLNFSFIRSDFTKLKGVGVIKNSLMYFFFFKNKLFEIVKFILVL